MPIITGPIRPNDSGQAVADLHKALLKYGAPIADAERTGKRFADSTLAAVLAFRSQHGLPLVTGRDSPFDASVARLLNVASAAAGGNRAEFRTAVRESVAAASNATPQENSQLARYAVIAFDYSSARTAALRAPQLSGLVTQIIEAPLDVMRQPPRPPEVPFPENFYTYRYKLLPQERLDELLGRTASAPPGSSARVLQRRMERRDGEGDWPEPPGEPEPEPEPPPSTEPDLDRQTALKEAAASWLEAVDHWQFGNEEFNQRRYASAVSAYTACQKAALNYFATYYPWRDLTRRTTLDERVSALVIHLASNESGWPHLWDAIRRRRFMLSLQELGDYDWGAVTSSAVTLVERNLANQEDANQSNVKALRQRALDRPLLILATIMAPLARAEANRLRRQYDAAERDLRRVLRPYQVRVGGTPPTVRDVWLTCDFIELPFARLILSETLLQKADAQYKARTPVAEVDAGALATAGAEYKNRLGDPGDRNQTEPFQLLQAAKTYLSIIDLFNEEGEYVNRVNQGLDALRTELNERLSQGDVTSSTFRAIGLDMTIPTIQPAGDTLPGTDGRVGPHEPLLKFEPPPGQIMREINPRVYSVLLEAQARLLQLWSWFNYLGYSDDYVPPWRFQFLLDRARYYCEHAKNAQREYLNFLSNAEREEFQELSVAQNVEIEKSNVRTETARVDQVGLEMAGAEASAKLADLSHAVSQARLQNFQDFDERADNLDRELIDGLNESTVGAVGSGAFSGAAIGSAGGPPGALAGAIIGGFYGWMSGSGSAKAAKAQLAVASEQREYEKLNLAMALLESDQAATVARRHLEAAQAGLVVAGLQRQTALLRHEFALQNLAFLRNRILNAELWYRLSAAIRSVSETYLRYAIEMAFLAEQSYEFEADKRINVIRFDYDVSDLGDMLAGDFLLRDLDTLEQDLIVGQKIRQQQVRYVLSLAREFPEALRELRDNGQMTFSLRLEQLERRFPGLFNLRISSVEVLPLALMDATRFSLNLTHLGSGQVRLRTQPGTPPETPTADWLSGLETEWSVKFRTTGPDTAVFSGLTRQEQAGLPSFFISNQRGAFEGLAGASSWQIDLSMKENRIVPDTLADLLMTFTLSGYYDTALRNAIDHAPRKPLASTAWFSAHQHFPDAFYQFNRAGRMEWQVTPDFLALQGSLGELQNVAVLCSPSQKRPDLGRLMCSYPIEFEIDATGTVRMLRELPRVALTTNGLVLSATLNTPAGSSVTFDFGDGTGLADSATLPHTYAKPGRYDVRIRIARAGRLTEYRAAVVVSRQHTVLPPCIVIPQLPTTAAPDNTFKLRPSLQPQPAEPLSVTWRIDNHEPDAGSDPVTFTLGPGRYVLRFSAIRPLKARFYSQQRYTPTAPLMLKGLHLATNRTFDVTTGAETTSNLNAFGQHVFGPSPSATLSPIDRWTLELPLEDNPCVVSVSSTDMKQHDLGELADVFLALEYKIKDE